MSVKTKALVALTLLLPACGTIFSGSSQTITFDSNVKENIEIYANGALVCTKTPCTVDIDRSSGSMTILAKAKGYEDAVMQNKAKINTASWGNLLSVYSWTTDFATSAMWKYSQDGVYINMRPKENHSAQNEQFEKDSNIRRFALYNYGELRVGNHEYLTALKELTDKNEKALVAIINRSSTEVELAHNLTEI
ncbi:MAG: hypothetical protein IJ770_00400 [Alphaproteobacteria bacterium]|nr:hypothetical protein [Alphaproteobacteria bacterium]